MKAHVSFFFPFTSIHIYSFIIQALPVISTSAHCLWSHFVSRNVNRLQVRHLRRVKFNNPAFDACITLELPPSTHRSFPFINFCVNADIKSSKLIDLFSLLLSMHHTHHLFKHLDIFPIDLHITFRHFLFFLFLFFLSFSFQLCFIN